MGAYLDERVEPWGRVAPREQRVAYPRSPAEAAALVAAADTDLLGVGLHRSYGDSSLNPDAKLISGLGMDRFIAFDPSTGVLRAQAGVSLKQILAMCIPHGWFLPTTPGTMFVTLGGAIGNDVHGKNHHRSGSMGRHVTRIGLVRSDRGPLELSPTEEPELFYATIGGLGLTGLITWAELNLSPIASSDLKQETLPFANLAGFFALTEDSDARFEHISAWVDCTATGKALGRGVLFRANWAEAGPLDPPAGDPKLSAPPFVPNGLMNFLTLRGFNTAFRVRQSFRHGVETLNYEKALYPLDKIGGWNLFYGPNGFYQHQFMVPLATQEAAVAEVLQTIAAAGQGSFLAVLKTLGPARSGGLISFEGPGASLALDFPNRGASTLALLERLDRIVVAAGGKIYPAKDARMSATTFQASYPRWEELERLRDPRFVSAFWRRVTR